MNRNYLNKADDIEKLKIFPGSFKYSVFLQQVRNVVFPILY